MTKLDGAAGPTPPGCGEAGARRSRMTEWEMGCGDGWIPSPDRLGGAIHAVGSRIGQQRIIRNSPFCVMPPAVQESMRIRGCPSILVASGAFPLVSSREPFPRVPIPKAILSRHPHPVGFQRRHPRTGPPLFSTSPLPGCRDKRGERHHVVSIGTGQGGLRTLRRPADG